MKTIIAGSRGIKDVALIYKAVQDSGFIITEVVSGGCNGVDKLGEKWALANAISVTSFLPNWNNLDPEKEPVVVKNQNGRKYNLLAGLNRNTRMINYADALIAIWDGSSTGTLDIIQKARTTGLKVYILNTKNKKDNTNV